MSASWGSEDGSGAGPAPEATWTLPGCSISAKTRAALPSVEASDSLYKVAVYVAHLASCTAAFVRFFNIVGNVPWITLFCLFLS